ncbi:glycosyltransferase family 2 protein [Rhodoligotrophos ferricapiens]|uniref:glycosyltransferase family 2 protein n=1 Tax=Rhodoligotrophos ferricapiens TaxID=3069264 RepID=UPI00315DFF12
MSIVITARNAGDHIEAAIRSLLEQTYEDFELLVVDDHSTDDTAQVVCRLAAEDSRIVCLSSPEPGRIPALNAAIAAARGCYLAIMDADDLADPHRLAMQVSYLDQHPNVVAVGSALSFIGPTEVLPISLAGRKISVKPERPRSSLGGWKMSVALVHATVMMRLSSVIAAGAYRPALIYQEDNDLFLRLEELGEIRNLPNVLHHYRQHANNTSRRHVIAQCAASRLALALAQRRRRGKRDFAYIHGRAAVWALLVLHSPATALGLVVEVAIEVVRRIRKRRSVLGMLRDRGQLKMPLHGQRLA